MRSSTLITIFGLALGVSADVAEYTTCMTNARRTWEQLGHDPNLADAIQQCHVDCARHLPSGIYVVYDPRQHAMILCMDLARPRTPTHTVPL